MKKLYLISIFSLVFFLTHINQPVLAQSNRTTKISYKVDFGPVYPIEGQSNQLEGQLGLNDTTGAVEQLNFNVPLVSFQGTNAGYLGWIANSWYNPDLEFESKSIEKKDDHWVAKGMLDFRRRHNPVEIEFHRKNIGSEIFLEGNFELRPRDYFISTPSLEMVPSSIPMKFTMLYDLPSETKEDESETTTSR